MIVQELFLGQLPQTQEVGEFQLTTVADWAHSEEDSIELALGFEFGLTSRLQIGVELPYEWVGPPDRSEGLGAIEIGLLYGVWRDAGTGRGLSVGLELGLPAIDPGEEGRAWELVPSLILYQGFDEGFVNLAASLEIEVPTGAGATETRGRIALGAGRRFDTLAPTLEVDARFGTGAALLRIAPGLTWTPATPVGRWEFGLAVPIGVTSSAPDVGVIAVILLEFGGD